MAEFKLKQETVDLLKESDIDSDGHLRNIARLNDELKQIVLYFIDVSQSWCKSIAPCNIYADDNWLLDILLKRKCIEQNTIDTEDGKHFVLHCDIQKDGTTKFNRFLLPDDIPYRYYMDTIFNEEKGILRILQSPPIGDKYSPVFIGKKLIINGKQLDMRPQLVALYKLFKEHPEGLVLKDILRKHKEELLENYKNQNGGNDYYGNFINGIENAKKSINITDKINHLISDLRKCLETKNKEIVMPFHNVRPLLRKGHEQIYFVPYFFLNDSNISMGTDGKCVSNK